MKYLEAPTLAALSSKLNQVTESDMKLNCRIELYSCKMSTVQKKLSRKLRQDYLKEADDVFVTLSDSSKGKMDDPESCKVYGYLISTLNESFQDYDFSSVKPDQFQCVDSVNTAVNTINRHLCEVSEMNMANYTVDLWNEVDQTIQLKDCIVYTYISDLSDDPLSEGQIWSFNYFFYNKELRKVLFIACTAKSAFSTSESYNLFPGMSQEDVIDEEVIDM
ncbi:hypothetical protein WA171_006072 [Blastocystis sp. BT1]